MNPGYVSLLVAGTLAILLLTGWRDLLVPRFRAGVIVVFYAGSLLLSDIGIPVGNVWVGGFWLFLASGLLSFLLLSGRRYLSLAIGLFGLTGGQTVILMDRIYNIYPEYAIVSAEYDPLIVVTLAAFILIRRLDVQLAALTFVWLWSDLLHAWLVQTESVPLTAHLQLGGATFCDRWWLSVGACRLLSLGLEVVYRGMRNRMPACSRQFPALSVLLVQMQMRWKERFRP